MYYSCLLLLSILTVFSNVNAASVHRRGLIPSNINIDIKLGKGSTVKNAAPTAPPEGRKTILNANAPFGLGSLTITTNRKNSSTANTNPINELGKPCNPEAENIAPNGNMKKPSGTLGGKGDAMFGPPHPPPHEGYGPPSYSHPHPHPDFGPPPSDFHHPYYHYPPPPPHHHFHSHPHEHNPDCNHEPPFPPTNTNTKVPIIPENKPDAKVTPAPIPNGNNPQTNVQVQSTTDNVDALIGDIFGGSNSPTSTTSRTKIDEKDREQTGEDKLDIRMPSSR